MTVGFRRSSSHVRSNSHPCLFHPLLSDLHSAIQSLYACQHQYSPSYTWLSNTLTHLELLLANLDDVLYLPEAQQCFRRRRESAWADTILNNFLLLADTYAQLRDAVVSLHQLVSDVRVASRRKDEKRLNVATRERKKLEKDVSKLLSSLRELGKAQDPIAAIVEGIDIQIVGTLREARVAFYAVSAAVFVCIIGLSSSSFSATTMVTFSSWSVVRKLVIVPSIGEEEKWKEMDGCMIDMESGIEKVLRRLLNTRVLLLNVLEPL